MIWVWCVYECALLWRWVNALCCVSCLSLFLYIVKNLWDSAKDWFNLKCPQHTFPNLTLTETIFGLTNTQDAEIMNWIILVAKKYVYYNRIKNSVPCIQVFEKYLGMYFKTEKQVAFSNCEWKSFDKKWSMYKHIFEA